MSDNIEENLKKVMDTIANMPVEKPEMYYQYKDEPMTLKEFIKWYECIEIYYHIAQRYEQQERGSCCSVDRAYSVYLKPECKKMLEHLKKNGIDEG